MKLKALSGEILKSSKPSDGRAIYAMWAGYGADPILDPELFATLPPRVQREKWELRRIWDNNPELTAQEGLTLLRKKQENVVALPPVPDWFKYHFPEVPYAIFSLVGDGVDLTPQQLNLLETHIASDSLLGACRTEEGNLTTVKPLDGVYSYIWRHARLITGGGVKKMAVDDFGTGYSSLSYLNQFPLDVIKIDQSFVEGIGYSKDNGIIVGAVIGMGNNLRLKVIAEGIENLQQLDFLKALNCEEGQGYFFSKSISSELFVDMLKSERSFAPDNVSLEGANMKGTAPEKHNFF